MNKPENLSSRNSESIWGDKHVSRMVLALSCICNINNDTQRIQIGQFCLDSNFSVLSRQSGRAFQGKGNRVGQSEGIMLRPTHKHLTQLGGFIESVSEQSWGMSTGLSCHPAALLACPLGLWPVST